VPHRSSPLFPQTLAGAKPAPFPRFIPPCLASLRNKIPAGTGFVHELKLDGYRVQGHLHDGQVKLYTRSGFDWGNRFPTVAADLRRMPGSFIVDGEVISSDERGRPSFSALQDDLNRGRYDRMVYYVFDLLYLDGFDIRAAPLIERKRALQSIMSAAREKAPRILFTEHFTDGAGLYEHACEMGLEGIVSKEANAPYRAGRREHWLKIKCWKQDRFAVVGFVPLGSRGLRKLRLARRDGDRLVYVGRVGTGWDRETAREIRRTLEPLAQPTSPLTKPIMRADTTWIEPRLDAEIRYAEISDDGILRHPSFRRLLCQ
jgi:bifunctional non-homologous end joining protein LigD